MYLQHSEVSPHKRCNVDLSCTTGHCLQVQLPLYIDGVREKLAENLHELWAMRKVEQGWSYDEVKLFLMLSIPYVHRLKVITLKYILEFQIENASRCVIW